MEKIRQILIKSYYFLKKNPIALLAGLAIMIIAICLFWVTKPEDIDTSKAAKELVLLNNNIRRFYQNRPDFWGLSTDSIIKNKIYPLSMQNGDGLKNIWDNQVFVGQGEDAKILMPGARSFDVIYKKMSNRQCSELASFRFEEGFWLGVRGITLNNGKNVHYFSWSDKKNILPIAVKRAEKLCKNDNILIWHFE